MASKNLVISFSHPGAVSNTIRYARIDNTVSPVYTTVSGITVSPYIVQNQPNGQYKVFIKPVYSDGRVCTETSFTTDACTGITSLSAIEDTGNFVISYTADAGVPYVQVTINYPNGGTSITQHANTGTDITIPIPTDVFGTYSITMSPVCDVDSGFIGAPTAPVTVEVTEASP